MAEYATSFLVLNLGSEMIFVVAQRLSAQGVPPQKAALVLEDIIYNLISPEFFLEISQPQEVFEQKTLRAIIEEVAQSSAMKMDATSKDRLWDLITVVFKWQVTLSHELIKITLRHLYEIETFTLSEKTQLQLHRVQNTIENLDKILTMNEKDKLRSTVLYWLSPFKAKISLLIRLGLQSTDGNFLANNTNPIAQAMLKNLGENIYAVTQNGKITDKAQGFHQELTNELQVFADQILGNRKLSSTSTDSGPTMKLLIDDQRKDETVTSAYDNIEVEVGDTHLEQIFSDLNLVDDDKDEGVDEDELLDLIGTET